MGGPGIFRQQYSILWLLSNILDCKSTGGCLTFAFLEGKKAAFKIGVEFFHAYQYLRECIREGFHGRDLMVVGFSGSLAAVSYTHLTLPTKA